jgi:soluble lytic murein transglycosylase-like protein
MNQESGGNQFTNSGGLVTSSAGAIGLFQLMPTTAAGLGVNPADPTQNIAGGLAYLQQLYNQFGDWQDALEAYNGGPAHVLNGTVSAGAQAYAASVLAAAGLPADSSASDTSGDGSDLTLGSDLSPSSDSGVSEDGFSLSDVSGGIWAIVGIAVLGLAYALSR